MEVTKTLKISYPTVTYHSAELFVAVKVTESDIPEGIQSQDKFGYLNTLADSQLIHAFQTEYGQVNQHLVQSYGGQYVSGILTPEVEAKLIHEGRIRTDAQGKFK